METTYYIYLITCMARTLANGKIYIGCSSNPEQRWNNGNGYSANLQFYNDIKKYGWQSFTKQILWKTDSAYDAAIMESFLIDKTDCSHPRIGYNNGMFYFIPTSKDSEETYGIMYSGIPASAYRESRAWDIISELSPNSNLALFLKEQNIIPEEFFEDHDLWNMKRPY